MILAHGGRADGTAQDVAGRDRGPEVLVEQWRRVEPRVVRRHVDHEHRSAGLLDLLGERVEPRVQLFLGLLARVSHGVWFDQPLASS